MIKELTCIQCPMGCPLKVELEGEEIISVTGFTCKRGEIYARKEVTAPTRTVTSTVAVKGGEREVVAVKTASDIPKNLVFPCMEEIAKANLSAPVKIGDIVIENICGTGVNLVATAEDKKA